LGNNAADSITPSVKESGLITGAPRIRVEIGEFSKFLGLGSSENLNFRINGGSSQTKVYLSFIPEPEKVDTAMEPRCSLYLEIAEDGKPGQLIRPSQYVQIVHAGYMFPDLPESVCLDFKSDTFHVDFTYFDKNNRVAESLGSRKGFYMRANMWCVMELYGMLMRVKENVVTLSFACQDEYMDEAMQAALLMANNFWGSFTEFVADKLCLKVPGDKKMHSMIYNGLYAMNGAGRSWLSELDDVDAMLEDYLQSEDIAVKAIDVDFLLPPQNNSFCTGGVIY
jgi:hypothetical protein